MATGSYLNHGLGYLIFAVSHVAYDVEYIVGFSVTTLTLSVLL